LTDRTQTVKTTKSRSASQSVAQISRGQRVHRCRGYLLRHVWQSDVQGRLDWRAGTTTNCQCSCCRQKTTLSAACMADQMMQLQHTLQSVVPYSSQSIIPLVWWLIARRLLPVSRRLIRISQM